MRSAASGKCQRWRGRSRWNHAAPAQRACRLEKFGTATTRRPPGRRMRRASSRARLRIVEVLEHVPDHHLVEVRRRIGRVAEARRDPDLGARIGAARGLERDLDAVHLEAAVGERAEDHAAAAAHVEHARTGPQIAREEADVALADPAHQALDDALELATGLAVVFVRVEGRDLLEIGHRMQTPEPTALADEHARREALDREGGAGLLRSRRRDTASRAASPATPRRGPRCDTDTRPCRSGADLSRVRGNVRGGPTKVKGSARRAAWRLRLRAPRAAQRSKCAILFGAWLALGALALALAARDLSAPGLYYDEVIQAEPASEFLAARTAAAPDPGRQQHAALRPLAAGLHAALHGRAQEPAADPVLRRLRRVAREPAR